MWQRVWEERGRRFRMVAVAQDAQGEDRVRPVVEAAGVTYPVLVDRSSVLARALGFRIVPTGVFVDAGGTIRYRHVSDFTAVLGMALLAALVLFFNNAFEGGFKDHASDELGGKQTLVLSLRARGIQYDSPDGLVVLTSLAFHALLLAIAVAVAFVPMSTGSLPTDLVRALSAAVLVAGMARFFVRAIAARDRKQMLARFAAHEVLAVLLLILVLLPHLAAGLALVLFLAPLAVFLAANRALYGTLAAPDV